MLTGFYKPTVIHKTAVTIPRYHTDPSHLQKLTLIVENSASCLKRLIRPICQHQQIHKRLQSERLQQ